VVRNLKYVALLMTLSLIATSCGDSAGSTVAPTGSHGETVTKALDLSEIEFEQDAIDAAVALIERLGMPAAVDAFILAVDAGYTPDQLILAATDGSLRSDGTIETADGGTASPQGEPAGVIDRGVADEAAAATYQAVLAMAAEPGITVESVREAGLAQAEESFDQGLVNPTLRPYAGDRTTYTAIQFIAKFLFLLDLGFSGEDAILAVLLGAEFSQEWAEDSAGDLFVICWTMTFPDGDTIGVGVGGGQCDRLVSNTTTTTQPATTSQPATPDEDLVYRGVVDVTLVYADTDGFDPVWPTNQCATTPEATLTIRPDGTASLVVDWLEFVAAPGSGVFTGSDQACQPRNTTNMKSRAVEGTWDGFFFEVGITEPWGSSISPVEGSFGDAVAAAAGSLALRSGPSDQPITGDFSFNLTRVTE
jgi:hypothetical protein